MIESSPGTRAPARYVYICSAGFSGSTLLGLVLGAHSQGVSLGEITHLPRFVSEDQGCLCGVPMSGCAFWQDVLAELAAATGWPRGEMADLPLLGQGPTAPARKRAAQLLAAAGMPRLARGLERWWRPWDRRYDFLARNDFALYDAARKVSGKTTSVDSSKFYLRMKYLHMHRPGALKVVHLVRDGRGVMASNMKRDLSAEVGARRWRQANRGIVLVLRSMPAETHIRVKYEAFCARPEAELRRVLDFLGLPYEAASLSFRDFEHHDLGGNRMRFRSETEIVDREAWRQELTPRDLATFERIGGRLNRRLGYR